MHLGSLVLALFHLIENREVKLPLAAKNLEREKDKMSDEKKTVSDSKI